MKILIPLDGSKTGEAALPYVHKLLSTMSPRAKIEIILFQVVSITTHYVVAGEAAAPVFYTEDEITQLQQQAEAYLDNVGEDIAGDKFSVEVRVGTGDAADEVIKLCDELAVDLVAMSTHGRSGISRWAFGSVTDKVLRGGSKPVLVVRAPSNS